MVPAWEQAQVRQTDLQQPRALVLAWEQVLGLALRTGLPQLVQAQASEPEELLAWEQVPVQEPARVVLAREQVRELAARALEQEPGQVLAQERALVRVLVPAQAPVRALEVLQAAAREPAQALAQGPELVARRQAEEAVAATARGLAQCSKVVEAARYRGLRHPRCRPIRRAHHDFRFQVPRLPHHRSRRVGKRLAGNRREHSELDANDTQTRC